MRTDSLFSELVLRLAPHPENIATESLLYILRKYPEVWTPLAAWIGLTGISMPPTLAFRTQVLSPEDDAIPDLVGTDSVGDPVFIVEAKFWADLTPNQPATYLRRLPNGKQAILLVIVPGLRFEIVWSKLLQNCRNAAIMVADHTDPAHELRAAAVAPTHVLALTSWRAVLTVLLRDADPRRDMALCGDVEQLGGLCSRMDSTEFLPLTPKDVERHIGQRVQQFADLVDTVVAVLVRDHGATTKGLTTGGRQSTYGRFFRLASLGCFLAYMPPLWSRYGETPLWLNVKLRNKDNDNQWDTPLGLCDQVYAAFAGRPNRVCEHEGGIHVGINLPVGVESREVVTEVVGQILFVAAKCGVPSAAT